MLSSVLGLINGGYMFVDGIFVIIYGEYIGSEKPGSWAAIFQRLSLDIFRLGPMTVGFGLVWLIFLIALWIGLKRGQLVWELSCLF